MATLYRKYRPQNFTEVVGQNHIKVIMQHELLANQLAHAYLFCGPRAVGKTTLARVLSKAANCANRQPDQYEPCGVCDSCVDITSGRSFDVIEIDAASHTGVDNVRENIIASARIAPSKLKRKVFIIDEVHMLSTQAFNALLKTLEEPPEFVLFILCTTEVHKVPATIISRCQRFDFKRISLSEAVRKLTHIVNQENIKIDKNILESVARHADGHMRDAESLLGQLVNLGGKEISQADADLVIPRSDLVEVASLIEILANKDAAAGIRLVNKLIDEGVDIKVFMGDVVEMLRKLMLMKINPALSDWLGLELGESLEVRLSQIGKSLTQEQLLAFLEHSIKVLNELKSSFIIQLPLELMIARICTALPQSAAVSASSVVTTPPAAKPDDTVKESASKSEAINPGNLDYGFILSKWNEYLVRIKTCNYSLSFIMKACQPKSLHGNELCLAFKYKFHKDRIMDPTIKSLLERVLRETYLASLTIEAVIDEQLEVPAGEDLPKAEAPVTTQPTEAPVKAENDKMVDNLLKAFGGKVVG